METLAAYWALARETSAAAFAHLYPCYFLFKHPKGTESATASASESEFTTRTSANFDPLPGEFRLIAVKKRAGNPSPDRFTLGRAADCDVVFRFAFISKLHAILFIQGAKITILDNKPSNSTFHNHEKLEPGSARSMKLGDTLGLGALELELMNAAHLHALLRARPNGSSS